MAKEQKSKISQFQSNITATVSVALVLILIGITAFLSLSARSMSRELKENMGFSIVLKADATDAQIATLKTQFQKAPYAAKVQYISKAEALQQWKEDTGEDLIQTFGVNPLSAEFQVNVKAAYANVGKLKQIQAQLQKQDCIEEVALYEQEMEAANQNISNISIVLLIVAAVASFAIAFEVTDDAPRMATVGTAGYAVMGVCLFCVRLIARKLEGARAEGVAGSAEFACVEGAGAEAGGAGGRSAASRRRARQQVALLAVAGAVVSLMSYAHYFGMDDQTVRCGQVSDILLFVALGLFVAFMLYVNRNSLRRTRATLPVVLCLVAVVFVVLLVAMFVFMSSNVFAYGSSRFVRRLSLVIAGISTLIVVYRYGLAPVRTFTIAFLGPALVMKPVQVALLAWAPAVAEGLGNGILTSAAIALGLCLTMFLVVFCLANFNDQLARALLAGSGSRGDAGAADGASAAGLAGNAGLAGDATSDAESREEARRAACEAVRKAHGLTSRETDILFHFSGGATAQATADALTISTNTVNTHAMSLYRKLDVHTKQELIDLVRGRMKG